MAATESDLIEIIAKESLMDKSKLVRGALLADLGIQSIDLISILFVIEEKYGTVIEEAEFPKAETLGDMLDYLSAKISAETAAAQAS